LMAQAGPVRRAHKATDDTNGFAMIILLAERL
jgi:hypothetical protein